MANEESYMFAFNKKDLKNILKTNISEDLEEKMTFLKALDLFKGLSDEVLLPIVNTLKTMKFTYG